ncbi:MAG: hypothetical protein M2R45_03895 [Verrucomicrobia subdivision 3 bacterium]|nr:hypothetical protein [Limisphaerales bacterium]MCS1412598.1 hypothetical protein [Limisphaerales bacterium]
MVGEFHLKRSDTYRLTIKPIRKARGTIMDITSDSADSLGEIVADHSPCSSQSSRFNNCFQESPSENPPSFAFAAKTR